jgi:CBS domain-containing protein
MKVKDVMVTQPKCCGPDSNLAEAVELMWTNDCGFLPVVDGGALVGVLTDRDICIALGTRNQRASDVLVKDTATTDVRTCEPEDELHAAMAVMRKARVHRLPVVHGGAVTGILSLDDILMAANRVYGAVDYTDLINTMIAVSEHGSKYAPDRIPTPPIPVVVA